MCASDLFSLKQHTVVIYDKKPHGLGASVVSTEGTTRRIKNKNGNHSILDVPFPSAIKYYNKFMGGVDKSDQLIGYHRVIHHTKNIGKPYSTICLKSV